MWILIASLIILGIFSWLATHYNWFNSSKVNGKPEDKPSQEADGEVCCGLHEVCETDTLMAYNSKAEYYDDEELDIFSKKSFTEYSQKDTELFESVFYTLKPEEVAGWLRSLQVRGIELPPNLRDEALLIVSERRQIS